MRNKQAIERFGRCIGCENLDMNKRECRLYVKSIYNIKNCPHLDGWSGNRDSDDYDERLADGFDMLSEDYGE